MIPWWVWVLLVTAAVAVYLRSLAGRLDRLHIRVEAARSSLDAALADRNAAALELAASGLLDPASSLLVAEAAHDARESTRPHRPQQEGDLSRALRAALDDQEDVQSLRRNPAGEAIIGGLGAAGTRVVYARQFHNEVVRATLRLRERPVVKGLRLAGTAPWPTPFEMDDAPPAALVS
ncbi:MAG: hypothetical protein ABWZ26_08745 [Candidatus Nanopelagicales bacterium]